MKAIVFFGRIKLLRIFPGIGNEGPAGALPVIADHRVGKTQRAVRVGLHIVVLLLQFMGIRPVIIPLTDCDISAPDPRPDLCLHNADPLGPLVFGLADRPDDLRIFCRVCPDDRRGSVRRGIIMNDHLEVKISLLTDHSLQGSANGFFVIICQAVYTHRYHIPVSSAALLFLFTGIACSDGDYGLFLFETQHIRKTACAFRFEIAAA